MVFKEIIFGFIVGFILTKFYEWVYLILNKKLKKQIIVKLKGFHIHHSIYGLFFIGLSTGLKNLFLLGIGLGIIVQHTIFDKKFTFIDKN